MRFRQWFVTALLVLCASVAAPGAGAQIAGSLSARRDSTILQAMREGGMPGIQTVVVKNGRTVWQRSYGYAVLAKPGPVRPMRDNTISFTASIGKILTAIAVMQQVEQGHIALDDDIDKSVPFVIRNPKWPDVPITWRMLLTHTSSVIDDDSVYDNSYTYGGDASATLEQFLEGRTSTARDYHLPNGYLPAKPGTDRTYCSFCFDLMGYALARVTHESFDSYIERNVIVPLKMKETATKLRAFPESVLAVGYGRTRDASGGWIYSPNRESFGHLPAAPTILGNIYAAPDPPSGVFYSSARDFARPMLMLLNHGTLDGVKVLDSTSVNLMVTPTGFYSSTSNYAQGLCLYSTSDLDDHQVWGHVGEDRGFITTLFFSKESGIGIVSFANANKSDFFLSRRLVDLDLHMMEWFK